MLEIRGTAVSGTIPSILGQLSLLKILLLDYNALTGSIPSELALLTELEEFVADGNELEGSMPTGFAGTDWENLELLRIADTLVSGTIPDHSCSFAVFNCSDSLCGCNCTCAGETFSP